MTPSPTPLRRVRREVVAFCPTCHAADPHLPLDRVARLPAVLVEDRHVWLRRTCPEHGEIETLYDEDPAILDYLERWTAPTKAPTPDEPFNDDPVPAVYRRGLGAAQRQHTCILLEDVTNTCNLSCPTCYASSAPGAGRAAPLETVLANVDRRLALEGGTLDVVMVSGGEPTVYPQLLPLLGELTTRAVTRILVNTNGLRFAHDDRLLEFVARHRDRIELYFQFDGFRADTWMHHRGRDVGGAKREALGRLCAAGVFSTLVMTAALGVNDDEIGDVVLFALETPFVGGVCVQPVFGSGRSAGIDPSNRLTHTGVLARLEAQTGGVVSWRDLIGLPCSHPHCASVGYLLRGDDGAWHSLTQLIGHDRLAAHLDLVGNRIVDPSITVELKTLVRESLLGLLSNRSSMTDRRFRDLFRNVNSICDLGIGALLRRTATLSHDQDKLRSLLASRVKRLQVKPFMDINTMIEERLLQCCVHVGTEADGHRCVPFCAAQAWPELSAMKPGMASVTSATGDSRRWTPLV